MILLGIGIAVGLRAAWVGAMIRTLAVAVEVVEVLEKGGNERLQRRSVICEPRGQGRWKVNEQSRAAWNIGLPVIEVGHVRGA